MSDKIRVYNGNANLKLAGERVPISQAELEEYYKCFSNFEYFASQYCKIVSLDDGLTNFDLFDFQKTVAKTIDENRFSLHVLARQMGKSILVAAKIVWYAIFNENQHAAILANKMMIAREIFSRIMVIIEHLPFWMQPGVRSANKSEIWLGNGSKIFAAATTPSAVRGKSLTCLAGDNKVCILDRGECYFVDIRAVVNKTTLIRSEIDMKHYCVYRTINNKNGKMYIGFHSIADESEIIANSSDSGSIFKDGYLGSGKLLIKAIEKYGPLSFSQELIFSSNCREAAETVEAAIADEEFVKRSDVYNITIGGNVCILKGELNGFFNKKHSPESLAKMQETKRLNRAIKPWAHSQATDVSTGKILLTKADIVNFYSISGSPRIVNAKIGELAKNGTLLFKNENIHKKNIERYVRYQEWLAGEPERKRIRTEALALRNSNRVYSEQDRQVKRDKMIANRANNKGKWDEVMNRINKNRDKIEKTMESQRSKIWITSPTEKRNTRHCKDAPIPEGWVKGFAKYNDAKRAYYYNDDLQICKPMKEPIPEGWTQGFKRYSEWVKRIVIHNKSTNENKWHDNSEPIPEGWEKGRVKP